MKTMSAYQLERAVQQAIVEVKKVLDVNRNPKYPPRVQHKYNDKFTLVTFGARAAAASLKSHLKELGLTDSKLKVLLDASRGGKSVTLAFAAGDSIRFNRKEEREVVSGDKIVTTENGFFGNKKQTKTIVTTVTDYYWNIEYHWKLYAFFGVDNSSSSVNNEEAKNTKKENSDNTITLLERKSTTFEIVTNSDKRPYNSSRYSGQPLEVCIDWFIRLFDESGNINFSIDRTSKNCKTPAQNDEIIATKAFFFDSWRPFSNGVQHFINKIYKATQRMASETKGQSQLKDMTKHLSEYKKFPLVFSVFTFEENDENGTTSTELTLAQDEFLHLLKQHDVSLGDTLERVDQIKTEQAMDFGIENRLFLSAMFIEGVGTQIGSIVEGVERMLRDQVIAAVGKHIEPKDFSEYMDFHNRMIFRDQYRPRGFCYDIRREGHAPQGSLSIEVNSNDNNTDSCIQTQVMYAKSKEPMKFPLSAASEVAMLGDRYLHAAILHQFSYQKPSLLNLCVRARQFSSFVLMIGNISGPNLFTPSAAIILKNKDIPLLLETIPTPKEFKDAIDSLSPEQKRFCKAFRSMQLASTLFGVCVIQIKPQLEKVLNLPPDSLTKQIKLTQNLTELFIKYQIPSDLLSFAGDASESCDAKIAAVEKHVSSVYEVIQAEKDKELKEKEEERKKAKEKELLASARKEAALMDCASQFGRPRMSKSRGAVPKSLCMKPERMMMRSMAVGAAPPAVPYGLGAANALHSVDTLSSVGGAAPPEMEMDFGPSLEEMSSEAPHERQSHESQGSKSDKVSTASDGSLGTPMGSSSSTSIDVTKVPGMLDKRMEKFDADGSVRPTKIKIGPTWKLKSQDGLLSKPKNKNINKTCQSGLKNSAFDLLDALTLSGGLSIDHASLHVIIAATHYFDKTLMDTIVKGNVNPIEKVERTSLIVASTIQGKRTGDLIKNDQLERLSEVNPALFAISDS